MVHLLSSPSPYGWLWSAGQENPEAAHELRTALATLRLVVESGAASPTRAPAAVNEALRLVDLLGLLVTGLLARARVEAGAQEVELTPMRLG
ncbi:hypothetical protein [Kitasatospora sp. A2-31]|uniref:hypothetical protein n=1 Tax=Kitasatospora sp. A2-31 TaxID=2916414 RepID=UPI001EEDF993|nr:hypothetical protein [Kitasatospora sp. A2-31]MCG6498835.1 hypothetical protein [Kitasatospora sp. A2-31]